MSGPSKFAGACCGLLVLLAGQAAAQTEKQIQARMSRTHSQCLDRSGGVTVHVLNCIGAEIGRQDAALNATYKRVMRSSDKSDQGYFRSAQRTWIKARDAKCSSAASDEGGGSLAGIIYNDCILTETAGRVIWLEREAAARR